MDEQTAIRWIYVVLFSFAGSWTYLIVRRSRPKANQDQSESDDKKPRPENVWMTIGMLLAGGFAGCAFTFPACEQLKMESLGMHSGTAYLIGLLGITGSRMVVSISERDGFAMMMNIIRRVLGMPPTQGGDDDNEPRKP